MLSPAPLTRPGGSTRELSGRWIRSEACAGRPAASESISSQGRQSVSGPSHWIVGPYTLAVLPLTLVVNAILYRFQRRRFFNLLGLRVRRNAPGFVGFVLAYQMRMSPSP